MPTAPGYAECSYELKHALVSRSAFITFGVDNTETDPATLATQVHSAFSAAGSLFTITDSQVTMLRARVSIGTDGGEDNVGVSTTTTACTFSTVSAPPNCAVLVHKRSARGGRRGRGRMYLPWVVPITSIDEAGKVSSGDITRITAALGLWLTALNSAAGPLVLLHRPSAPGTIHPTTPGSPNVVTSLSVDPLIGTQRRRLGR